MSGTYLASPVFDYESTLLAGHPSSGISIRVEYLTFFMSLICQVNGVVEGMNKSANTILSVALWCGIIVDMH